MGDAASVASEQRFLPNEGHAVDVTVAAQEDAVLVTLSLDAARVAEWRGPAADLSVPSMEYDWPAPRTFGVGTVNSSFSFQLHRLTWTSNGSATTPDTREKTPPP